MSKIIIHNETEKDDRLALEYVVEAINRLIKMPDMSYCQFEDKTKVQVYHQKTCRTFYVY